MSRDEQVVRKLAKQLGAKIQWEASIADARSNPFTQRLYISKPGNAPLGIDEWFWTALHELGHIANQHIGTGLLHEMGLGQAMVAEQESQAWMWAIKHAERPLDEIGRATIAANLASYFVGYPGGYIGPNAKAIFDLVGRSTDTNLIQKIQPEYWDLAEQTWHSSYDHMKLAA